MTAGREAATFLFVPRSARESTIIVFLVCWATAMFLSWLTPDVGRWGAAQWTFYAASGVALAVFVGGLVLARLRRDPTARLDARAVFGIGLLVSGGVALVAEGVTASWQLPTLVFLGGSLLSAHAYLRVAERAWGE